VNNLREGVGYIFNSFMEAAGYSVGRARAYTGAAANIASQVGWGSTGWEGQGGAHCLPSPRTVAYVLISSSTQRKLRSSHIQLCEGWGKDCTEIDAAGGGGGGFNMQHACPAPST